MIKSIFKPSINNARRKSVGAGPNVIKNFIFGDKNKLSQNEEELKAKVENLYNDNIKLKRQLYEAVNKIAWWIPFPKLRRQFKEKFGIQ